MKYLLIALGVFGLDEYIKNKIEQKDTKWRKTSCSGHIVLQKYHNQGAFLNFGQSRPYLVRIISITLTLALTICFIVSLTKLGGKQLKWGLSLLLGGAYSNTYDRIKREYVVDYLSFQTPLKPLAQVIFNLSDFAVIIGALLCTWGYSK